MEKGRRKKREMKAFFFSNTAGVAGGEGKGENIIPLASLHRCSFRKEKAASLFFASSFLWRRVMMAKVHRNSGGGGGRRTT